VAIASSTALYTPYNPTCRQPSIISFHQSTDLGLVAAGLAHSQKECSVTATLSDFDTKPFMQVESLSDGRHSVSKLLLAEAMN
jgi:hypothetical protein